MGRNSRRPYEVDKLQSGLENVTKYVEDSKIRNYFQREKMQAKMTWIFSKGNYYYLEEKMRNIHSNLYNSLCLGSWKPNFQ